MTDFCVLDTYGHVLSPTSRKLGFDIFVFWPTGEDHAKLVGGINSHLNPGITAGQVTSWINLLEPSLGLQGIDPKTIQLYPAVVTKCNIVDCSASPKEGFPALYPADRLVPNSSYCCVTTPQVAVALDGPFLTAKKKWSFASMKAKPGSLTVMWPNLDLGLYAISEEIKGEVEKRDGNVCFLTRKSPASVTWIFPPTWTKLLSPEAVPLQSFFVEKARFLGKDNAAMMCESVASLMHSNKIGIDVDEGFRIIIFNPEIKEEHRKELDLILDLSFLSQDQGMVDMLRQHFRWCLLVYFLSGKEVADIFPLAYLADIMAAMGYEPEEVEGLRHQKAADWDTPTGKEVWALLEERYAMDNHT